MKTILMDLQGTLGGNPIGNILDFEFYEGSIDALKSFKNQGYRLVIVTNQSKIAAGDLTQTEFDNKRDEIIERLKLKHDIDVKVYCCPHSRYYGCDCKKSKIGLFTQALKDGPIDIKKSYMIGDMGKSDMIFAHNLKLKKILVLTGMGESSLKEYRHTWSETEAEYIANDIYEASNWVFSQNVQK